MCRKSVQRVVGTVIAFVCASSAQAQPSNGLIGYYPFDTSANDASGNSRHGVLNDGATISAAGRVGGCLTLNGMGNWVGIDHGGAYAFDVDTQAFTFALYAKIDPQQFTANGEFTLYQDRYGNVAGGNRSTDNLNGRLGGAMNLCANTYFSNVVTGPGNFEVCIPTAPLVGAWHHFAVTYSPLSQIKTLYVDGVAVGTASRSPVEHEYVPNPGLKLTVGAYGNLGTQIDNFLHGQIDELRIYNRELTQSEVGTLANIPDVAAFLPFEGNAADAGPHHYPTTVTGGVTYVPGRVGGNAAHFDGTSGFVTIDHGGGLWTNVDTQSYSLALWVRADPTMRDYDIVMSRASSAGPESPLFGINGDATPQVFNESTYYSDPPTDFEVKYPTAGLMGSWHHFVITYDRTTHTKTMYVDGQAVRTALRPNQPFDSAISNSTRIGTGMYGEEVNYFSGDLDDVRFYRRALSSTEVASLANMQAAVQLNPLLSHADPSADIGGTVSATYVLSNPNPEPVEVCLGMSVFLGSDGSNDTPNYQGVTHTYALQPNWAVTLPPFTQQLAVTRSFAVQPTVPNEEPMLAGPHTYRLSVSRTSNGNCGATPEETHLQVSAGLKLKRPRFGTTVITHGFQYNGDFPDDSWMLNMAMAIIDRSGRPGVILKYDPSGGAWESTESGPDYDPSLANAAGELVLLFDWASESNSLNDGGTRGFTQAAGDALFAALADPQLPAGIPPSLVLGSGLHLIGHSRGCCVNSEAAERLFVHGLHQSGDEWNATYIDPHPVDGQRNEDGEFAEPWEGGPDWKDRVPHRWRALGIVDVYRQENVHPWDFDGTAIDGAWNVDLHPLLDPTPDCSVVILAPIEIVGGDHTLTHVWYHGTIDPITSTDGSGNGACEMISRNIFYPPFSATPQGGLATGFGLSGIAGGSRAEAPNGNPNDMPIPRAALRMEIVNGNFEFGSGQHAGWLHHGGSGSAIVVDEESPGNPYLVMGRGFDGDQWVTSDRRVHNRLFVPENAVAVEFGVRVKAIIPGSRLFMNFGPGLPIGMVDLADTDLFPPNSPHYTTVTFVLPQSEPQLVIGKTHTFEVYADFGTANAPAEVHLDNFRFLDQIRCGPSDLGQQGGTHGPDGLLDNNDFVVFIDYFFSGDLRADLGQQGGILGGDTFLDNNDFVVFIQCFFAGCN